MALGVVADVAAKLVLFYWLTPRLGVAGIMLGQGLAPLLPIAIYLALTRRRPGFVGGFALGRSRGLPVAAALGCLGLDARGARLGTAVADAAGLGGTLAALGRPGDLGPDRPRRNRPRPPSPPASPSPSTDTGLRVIDASETRLSTRGQAVILLISNDKICGR